MKTSDPAAAVTTVYVHIGSHKTGTTALQAFAAAGADRLRAAGLHYPLYGRAGPGQGASHHTLVEQLAREGGPQPGHDPVGFLAEARAGAGGRDLLISAESLFRLRPEQRDRVSAAFRRAFAGADVVVVCALRPVAEMADSLYRNAYRVWKAPPEHFDRWFPTRPHFDYTGIVTAWLDALGARPVLLPYTAATRGRFVEMVFAAMGVAVDTVATPVPQRNPSLDAVDCLAKAIVLGDRVEPRLSQRFNRLAAEAPLTTRYAFVGRSIEASVVARHAASYAPLIALAPALAVALGPQVPPMDRDDIDLAAHDMARARAAHLAAHMTGRMDGQGEGRRRRGRG